MENNSKEFENENNLESARELRILDSLYSRSDRSPLSSGKDYVQQYFEITQRLGKIFESVIGVESIENARQFPFTTVFSIAEMILLSITKSIYLLLEAMKPEYTDEYLPSHCTNVAFLSCKVGIELGLTYNELLELCVAALLHDIGMINLVNKSYLQKQNLTEEERYKIEEHPIIGWNFFKALEDQFPWLLKVILEEHKRENNQGYPQWVKGELHIYSRIVGLCDTYESLSHERIFRKAFHPVDAMKKSIEGGKGLFEKKILKALIEAMSIYPIGSLVQLNNSEIVQVIQSTKSAPVKPVVCILEERKNRMVHTSKVIDLSKDNNRYITNVVYLDSYKTPKKPSE